MQKKRTSQNITERLTGDGDLQKADRMLKDILLECDKEEQRRKLNGTRKILRQHREKQKKQFYITSVAAGVALIAYIFMIPFAWKGCFHAENTAVAAVKSSENQEVNSSEDQWENQLTDQPASQTAGFAGNILKSAFSNSAELIAEVQRRLPEPVELLLTFTGDCILGTDENFAWDTSFNAYYESYGGEYFLANVRDIFAEDDLTIINMEGTLTEETARAEKQFAFKGDPEFVDVLTSASVEAANMANNHSHDYGEQSYLDTVNLLESNGIRTFGYDETVIIPVKGVNVGMFGIYELDDHLDRIPQMEADIAKLKEGGADIIVAVFHWSNELETVPDENQVTLAHMAIDEGADVVVGHHPHVVQGIETYNGKTIAYSLGNFCFGGNTHPTEMETMIFQQKFSVDTSREITSSEINVIPCLVSSNGSYNDYQPTVQTGSEAERILGIIDERSRAIQNQ